MLKRFLFTRIRNKLAFAFLLQIISIVTLVILFSYYNSRDIIRSNSIEMNDNLVKNGIENLDSELSSIQQVVYALFGKEEFIKAIPQSNLDEDNAVYNIYKIIGVSMQEILATKSNILSIIYIDNAGNLVYSTRSKASYQRAVGLNNMPNWLDKAMKRLNENRFEYVLIPTHPHLFIQSDFSVIDDMVYTYACSALDVNNGYKSLGVLMINFNLSKMSEICENVKPYDNSFTYIVGEEGTIVYDSNKTATGENLRADILEKIQNFKNYFTVKIDKTEYVVVYAESSESKWGLLSFVPESEYSKDINTITEYIVMIAVIAIGFSIFLTYMLSRELSKPIEALSKVMNKIEDGNIDLRAEEKSSDEIGMLSRNFNSLISKLRFVMKHEYELTIRQKDAELKALQAQINPHFLFNALQSISSIAAFYNIKEISTIVGSLGKIMRYSIKTRDNIVSIKEEFEHVTHFLEIYKVRLGDKLKYQINIPENIMGYSILKLTLQPIVENAIIHGFKNDETSWVILIHAVLKDGIISFEISDNGTGMSKENLEMLMEDLGNSETGFYSKKSPSIGLKNVYYRLKISYGESSKMEIDSEINVGTTVRISYPAILYKEAEIVDTDTDR